MGLRVGANSGLELCYAFTSRRCSPASLHWICAAFIVSRLPRETCIRYPAVGAQSLELRDRCHLSIGTHTHVSRVRQARRRPNVRRDPHYAGSENDRFASDCARDQVGPSTSRTHLPEIALDKTKPEFPFCTIPDPSIHLPVSADAESLFSREKSPSTLRDRSVFDAKLKGAAWDLSGDFPDSPSLLKFMFQAHVRREGIISIAS